MRLVAFYGLPFHRWCLEDTVAAARARGHEVVEIEHVPKHHHDWWTGSEGTKLVLGSALRGADFCLVADYPYKPIRELAMLGTGIVSVRHSLAARGNTYETEQGEPDVLPLFSRADQTRLSARGLLPTPTSGKAFVGTGCPWAAPLCRGRTLTDRGLLLAQLGFRADPGLPIVAVATTWNDWTSLDIVRELARDGSRIVVWRPHWAAAWRRPQEAETVRSFGAYIDDPLLHPSGLLMGADALVGDVSGIVLLGTLVRAPTRKVPALAGALPIVQVDPTISALDGSAQFDATGPEWAHRNAIGPRLAANTAAERICATVDGLIARDEYRATRANVARELTEPYTDKDSAMSLVHRLEQLGDANERS